MTASPGFTRLSIAAIIASVDPHVTTMFSSGSASIPLKRFAFAAIASRSGFAPHVIEYWWWGPFSASRAASTISRGGSKSGNPWARLIASCFAATRVISRMTLSGKCWTRAAIRRSLIRYPNERVARAFVPTDSPQMRKGDGAERKNVFRRSADLDRRDCCKVPEQEFSIVRGSNLRPRTPG